MATKVYTLTGECKWAKVWKPDQKYNKYGIDLKIDTKAMKTMIEMGLSDKIKEKEDGELWATFRRDPESMVFKGGDDRVKAGGPNVTGVEEGTDVGNGSTVTIGVTVYDYDNKFGKGKGSRLDTVHVDKLVEYKKPTIEGEPKSPFDA